MVTYYFGFPPVGESNLGKGIASLPLWLSLLPQGRVAGPVVCLPGSRLLPANTRPCPRGGSHAMVLAPGLPFSKTASLRL